MSIFQRDPGYIMEMPGAQPGRDLSELEALKRGGYSASPFMNAPMDKPSPESRYNPDEPLFDDDGLEIPK